LAIKKFKRGILFIFKPPQMLVLAYFWLPTSTMHRRNLAKQIRCLRIFWQFWRFLKNKYR
jgi:hypothetical protein